MNVPSTLGLLALTLMLAAGFAAPSSARSANADGQTAEPPPKPDAGATAQLNCIDQDSAFTQRGKSVFYVQTFENKCEARMRCAVFAYSLNARGPAHGHTTLILGPKSAGAAAKKSYALKVKGAGGFSTADRECRVL